MYNEVNVALQKHTHVHMFILKSWGPSCEVLKNRRDRMKDSDMYVYDICS